MSRKTIPPEVVAAACHEFMTTSDTIGEVALAYGISTSTVSRGLAERGQRQLRKYKTEEEYAMIKLLHSYGINNVDKLKEAFKP